VSGPGLQPRPEPLARRRRALDARQRPPRGRRRAALASVGRRRGPSKAAVPLPQHAVSPTLRSNLTVPKSTVP